MPKVVKLGINSGKDGLAECVWDMNLAMNLADEVHCAVCWLIAVGNTQ